MSIRVDFRGNVVCHDVAEMGRSKGYGGVKSSQVVREAIKGLFLEVPILNFGVTNES